MQIEIAEPGRMTQTGKSLLKLIQNNSMPVLDLLVRESIQNSLDAATEGKRYVNVEFLVGKFKKCLLNKELQGVTEALNKRSKADSCSYIAIKDSNTVGLTGKMHYDEVNNNDYGNLLKLVYEISKPQENEGAGGSWGLGKTVYFRIGIGLVLYYSRIKKSNGKYESRFAASLVEDETSSKAMIPKLPGKNKRGIAWWGKAFDDNKTKPETNERYITSMLDIFGISPYSGQETGTTIIIPYVEEKRLLGDNAAEYIDDFGKSFIPFWRKSLEEYLKVSIQKWYAPRLGNSYYHQGPFLRVSINGRGLARNDMQPLFLAVQDLYNRAQGIQREDDIFILNDEEVKVDEIRTRNVLSSASAGKVSYAKVSCDLLKMTPPDNKPNPYIYLNAEVIGEDINRPIICFTRKPGMIVNYEMTGLWADGINPTEKNTYILAIFVLDSSNTLLNANCTLEEYIRRSEMADHTSWSDLSIEQYNPKITSKIQRGVSNKISRAYAVEEDRESKLNSGLGKMFGDILLPPENFGRRASAGVRKPKNGGAHVEKHQYALFSIDEKSLHYMPDFMNVSLQIQSRREISKTGFEMQVASDNGSINVTEWEERMGIDMPFSIESVDLTVQKKKKGCDDIRFSVNKVMGANRENGVGLDIISSKAGAGYRVEVKFSDKANVLLKFNVHIKINRRDIKPQFSILKEE